MQKNMKLTPKQKYLVENNLSIVHWVIVKHIHVNHTIFGLSYEDLYQEGCIWLCKAAATYDTSRSQFSTYARKVILNGLISYCRHICNKEKHLIHIDTSDNGEQLMSANSRNAVDEFTARISFGEILDLLESRKPAYRGIARLGIEAMVFKIYGYNNTEIAVLYGVPPSHVGAWISRSAQKLRIDPIFLANLY